MFRDTQEELKRLEEQLLAEEELPQTAQEEEEISDEQLAALLGGDTVVIKEADLKKAMDAQPGGPRRYVGRYEAYNTDKADTDLERYSEDVRRPSGDRTVLGLSILALTLIAAILGVLVWWFVRFQGLIG